MPRQSIAIIGSGISGLGCAHFLHQRHDITVYEAAAAEQLQILKEKADAEISGIQALAQMLR